MTTVHADADFFAVLNNSSQATYCLSSHSDVIRDILVREVLCHPSSYPNEGTSNFRTIPTFRNTQAHLAVEANRHDRIQAARPQ